MILLNHSEVSKKLFPNEVSFINRGRGALEEYAKKYNISFSHFNNLEITDCSWANKDKIFIDELKEKLIIFEQNSDKLAMNIEDDLFPFYTGKSIAYWQMVNIINSYLAERGK